VYDFQAKYKQLEELGMWQHNAVGAFWDPAEVREVNKIRRRTEDVLRQHIRIEREVAKLRRKEEKLADVGVDIDNLYQNYKLLDWPSRGDAGE
jgi:hypothetical protein